jgi:hypothetical protein
MKVTTLTLYHCEICGRSSTNRQVIERCEAQGVKHILNDTAIEVQVRWSEWFPGIVKSAEIDQKTHKPRRYRIQAECFGKKIRWIQPWDVRKPRREKD